MRWVEAFLSGLLQAPALALLGIAVGLGARFAGATDLTIGSVAAAAAVVAAGLGHDSAMGPLTNATFVVPLAFAFAYVVHLAVACRPTLVGDRARSLTMSTLLAVVLVALVVWWRGSAPAGGTLLETSTLTLPGGGEVATAEVWVGLVGAVAFAALAVAVTSGRLGLRLRVLARAPELLGRTGHDPRRLTALLAAIAAAAAALGGVALTHSGGLSPLRSWEVLVLAAEVALIGGVGSLPGAVVAALAVSLVRSLGAEVGGDWVDLAPHLLTLAVVAVRRDRVVGLVPVPAARLP